MSLKEQIAQLKRDLQKALDDNVNLRASLQKEQEKNFALFRVENANNKRISREQGRQRWQS